MLSASNAQVIAKIAHLSDIPPPIEAYGTNVTDKKGRRESSLITPHHAPLRREGLPMRRNLLLLATMALTLLVASGVVLGAAIGSAGAKSSVVGPGESIQKAVNAAHPGDTIVVRGVHREDVLIRKNGIKLRGEDAVIEAPPRAKADSQRAR